ncbi:MAG: PIN domain-containing protein [Proteobacteria bacterium]|nr:PIN domain-containing protein [Pseudomonadota bacterium]
MIILDSSALLAVLLGEPGADAVKATFSEAFISAASLAEILAKAERRGIPSEAAYKVIVNFGIGIIPVDTLQARISARISLAPRELDLSLGDRLCIALAIAMRCDLLTSDGGIRKFEADISIRSFR